MNLSTDFHHLLRLAHIVAGMIGLVIFWIPVFARKGKRLHTVCGAVFTYLAYFVAATAAVSCGWALVDPIGFTGIERELSTDEVQRLSTGIRFFFSILAVLMTWTVSALQLGTYSMRTKGRHDRARYRVLAFQSLACLASVALALFGAWQLASGMGGRSFIPIALGLFGMLDSQKAIKWLLRVDCDPSRDDKSWWYQHMECMIGSGIAFHTAFFVFGFSRLTGLQAEGIWAIVPWIIPSAIGIPATSIWIGKYRRKFEGDAKTKEAAVVQAIS